MTVTTDPALYSIGGASRHAGISEHAIRVWELRYGAVKPIRSNGNHRRYTESQVRRLSLLRVAQNFGTSIAEMAKMSDKDLEILVSSIQQAHGKGFSAIIQSCNEAIDHLNPWILTDILRGAINAYGYLAVVDNVLVPVMSRVGDRWLSGKCGSEHEHLASATFRTFLGAALTTQTPQSSAPTVVAATLETEQHELSTLAAAVAAGVEGWRVAYLGPNSPISAIANVALKHHGRAILLGLTHRPNMSYLKDALQVFKNISSPPIEIICGGRAANQVRPLLGKWGAHVVTSIQELVQRLNDLKTEGTAK